MKKCTFIFMLFLSCFTASFAQTEISGYLDGTPADGITAGPAATFDLFSAVEACRNLVHDGKTDWYLPSREEILLFVNGTSDTGTTPGCVGANCNWNGTAATHIRTSLQWDFAGGTNYQFYVGFKHLTTSTTTGAVPGGIHDSTTGLIVRCVR